MPEPRSKLVLLQFYERAITRLDARVRALLLYYSRAEAEILSKILAGLAAGKVLSLRDRRRQEALARDILRAVDETTKVRVPTLVNQSFQIGTRIGELGTGEQQKALSRVNRDAIRLLTENLIEDLGNATQTVGRTVEDLFRKETIRVALAQVPEERPRTRAAFELERVLKEQGITAFVDRSGRRWSLSTYSEMAAYTVTQEAVNTAEFNFMTERGFDLVEINEVRDPCKDICLDFNGKTFSLTGRAQGYPVLKKRAPFHPRCRHFMFPSRLALQERRDSGWVSPLEPEEVTLTTGAV